MLRALVMGSNVPGVCVASRFAVPPCGSTQHRQATSWAAGRPSATSVAVSASMDCQELCTRRRVPQHGYAGRVASTVDVFRRSAPRDTDQSLPGLHRIHPPFPASPSTSSK